MNRPVTAREFTTKMASTFEGRNGRGSLVATEQNCPPGSGHALVAQIEHALDCESTPVPESLEKLFQAAHAEAPNPPQAMISYLERMFDSPAGEGDRRQSERASLLATITAIPLSSNFEPCGEPFKAAARDASEGGLSLLHTRTVMATYLALRWQTLAAPSRQINLLLRVDRCQEAGPYFEVAGEFVSRR